MLDNICAKNIYVTMFLKMEYIPKMIEMIFDLCEICKIYSTL
jgi:hypothetical protein